MDVFIIIMLWAIWFVAIGVTAVSERDQSREWHQKGIAGAGVRVGVVDTGLDETDRSFIHNLRYTASWIPGQPDPGDRIGHGTHVASLIASSHPQCPGIAPETELYSYRLFERLNTKNSDAWLIDAYNHAIHSKLHILNMSHGDRMPPSTPLDDKTDELVANGVCVVAAAGNYGLPSKLFIGHTSPGDKLSVLSVGALDSSRETVDPKSSRGFTRYRNLKPDVVASGVRINGARLNGNGCVRMSGTSMSAPVVSGVLALLYSAALRRNITLNPGAARQLIMQSAVRLPTASITEQGAGRVDISRAMNLLDRFAPALMAHPPSVDLIDDCVYLKPFCVPLFWSGPAVYINATLVHSADVAVPVHSVTWTCDFPSLVSVGLQYSPILWPYVGFLSISISSTGRVDIPTKVTGRIEIQTSLENTTVPVRFLVSPVPQSTLSPCRPPRTDTLRHERTARKTNRESCMRVYAREKRVLRNKRPSNQIREIHVHLFLAIMFAPIRNPLFRMLSEPLIHGFCFLFGLGTS